MFDWIPIYSYNAFYYHFMIIMMLVTLAHAIQNDLFDKVTKDFSNGMGYILFIFIVFYLGTRPVSSVFGDMKTYANSYNLIASGSLAEVKKDYIFNYFMIYSAKIMSDRFFFFLCAVIYIVPAYIFSRKYCGSFWFFAFFFFVGSYMFWPYGVNGIRNGMATSIFILALCFYKKKITLYLLLALSYGIHSSLIITIAAFLVAVFIKDPRIYIYIWIASIPLSLVGGSFWEGFFGGLGFGDDTRAADYLTKGNVNNDKFASIGFRWDFVFYSFFAVSAGWYFIFKKKIRDVFYIHLWGVFMIANAFWILVIRANFSNRFAYVSWFLMAPVIAYPLLRYKMWPHQYKIIGVVLTVYFIFTYLMFLKSL